MHREEDYLHHLKNEDEYVFFTPKYIKEFIFQSKLGYRRQGNIIAVSYTATGANLPMAISLY